MPKRGHGFHAYETESLFTFVNADVLGWLWQGYPEHRGATMAGICVPLKGSGTALKAMRACQQNCQNHCVFGEPRKASFE
jgi:hypothetical protein